MLWCLAALQLFLAPALQLPSGDYWEEWSPYGECSRSCGSGVTMKTRRCVTQRTDGGNNCVGPDMSYRSCNIQDCPGGSRDFREHQCSQFDGADFQGKRYNWLPYYGADNPCELNCIPRGENFFYRHKTAVVDGTPCHPGRKEVCVDGVCKAPPVPILPAENSIQCRLTIYGCCFDRMSAAAGPDGEGCPGPPDNVPRTTCSLPMAAGSCSGWTGRYFYDVTTTKCSHFWYGGCHGNNNNFLTRGDCQSRCPGAQTSQTSHTYQHSQPSSQLIQPSQPIQPGTGRDMSRVFTVQRGSSGGSTGGRQGTSVTGHAHRARVHVRPRHPYAVQQTHPAASLTQPGGVKIDQSDPSRVEALVGQTVVLPCRVSPAPSSTIIVEWRKDGVPLTTFRHHLQPNGSLLVGPLTKADSGWLLCVATRDRERDHRYIYLSVSEDPRGSQVVQDTAGSLPQDGADRTEETGVILQSVPQRQPSPRFSIDRSGSSSVEGKAGQTVRLACKIIPTSALSSVSIQWTRGGQTFNSLRHAQQADGTLVIGQLTSDDSDVYTCIGSTHSQLEQRQLTLKVQGELRITMVPNNVRVSQGSTAQLPCVVSGDNVNVGWSRNGVPVRPDSGRVQISSDGSLILNNVQPADEGSYTCNAYTGTYSVSATAEVRINKASQQGLDVGIGVPAECVDQPELANCELIVYARLCTSQYYSSFCCASCARHAHGQDRYGQIG